MLIAAIARRNTDDTVGPHTPVNPRTAESSSEIAAAAAESPRPARRTTAARPWNGPGRTTGPPSRPVCRDRRSDGWCCRWRRCGQRRRRGACPARTPPARRPAPWTHRRHSSPRTARRPAATSPAHHVQRDDDPDSHRPTRQRRALRCRAARRSSALLVHRPVSPPYCATTPMSRRAG